MIKLYKSVGTLSYKNIVIGGNMKKLNFRMLSLVLTCVLLLSFVVVFAESGQSKSFVTCVGGGHDYTNWTYTWDHYHMGKFHYYGMRGTCKICGSSTVEYWCYRCPGTGNGDCPLIMP